MNIVAVFGQNTARAARSPGPWASGLGGYCWYEGCRAEPCKVTPSPGGVQASSHPLLPFQMTPVSQKGDPRSKVPASPWPSLARKPAAQSPARCPPARPPRTQSSGHRAADAALRELRTERGLPSSWRAVSPRSIWPHLERAFPPGVHCVDKGMRTNPSSVRAAAPDFLSRRAAWNRQQRSHPRVPLLEAHCEPRGSQDRGDDPGNLSAPPRIRPPLSHPATHAAQPLPSAGLPRTGTRSAAPSLGPRGRREARVRSSNFKTTPGRGRPRRTNWGPGRDQEGLATQSTGQPRLTEFYPPALRSPHAKLIGQTQALELLRALCAHSSRTFIKSPGGKRRPACRPLSRRSPLQLAWRNRAPLINSGVN